MKERIVIPKDRIKVLTSCGHFPANGYFTFNKEDAEIEQELETFEELKELCRKLKIGDCEVYITLQLTDKMKLYFYDNGEIIGAYLDFEYEFSLVKGRTPQQMYQIIKSLIGEE